MYKLIDTYYLNMSDNIVDVKKRTTIAPEEFIGFKEIGKFELNTNDSKSLWIFKKNKKVENMTGSHVYLIVVQDKNTNEKKIMKIGASANKKGIIAAAGYYVGNGGRPSDRTTGIHYYIAREIYNKNIVSFWINMSPILKTDIADIFGNITQMESAIDPKRHEDHILECYFKNTDKYPLWNMQELGRDYDWEPSIKIIGAAIREKKKIEYNSYMDYDVIMKLYHWKHNKIDIFPNS